MTNYEWMTWFEYILTVIGLFGTIAYACLVISNACSLKTEYFDTPLKRLFMPLYEIFIIPLKIILIVPIIFVILTPINWIYWVVTGRSFL